MSREKTGSTVPNAVRFIAWSATSHSDVAARPASRPSTSTTGRLRRRTARDDVELRRRRPDPHDDRVEDDAPLGDPQVEVERAGGDGAHDEEEQRLGGQLAGEDDLVADLLEPPPVGDDADEGRGDEDQRHEGDDSQDE